jgi:hypothetical protein
MVTAQPVLGVTDTNSQLQTSIVQTGVFQYEVLPFKANPSDVFIKTVSDA